MGFGVPIAEWFRSDLRLRTEEALLSDDARNQKYFRPEAVRELFDQHMTGRVNHAYRLWNLLILELWLRRWT
jgi:asparagine synthase (glutamine-hydrolysing)